MSLQTKIKVISIYLSSDTIFALIFRPFLTQLHFTFLTPPFSLMLTPSYVHPFMFSCSRTDDKNTIQLYNWSPNNLSTGLLTF